MTKNTESRLTAVEGDVKWIKQLLERDREERQEARQEDKEYRKVMTTTLNEIKDSVGEYNRHYAGISKRVLKNENFIIKQEKINDQNRECCDSMKLAIKANSRTIEEIDRNFNGMTKEKMELVEQISNDQTIPILIKFATFWERYEPLFTTKLLKFPLIIYLLIGIMVLITAFFVGRWYSVIYDFIDKIWLSA